MNGSGQPLTEAMFYILLALHQPLHGYGITREIEEMTDGRLKLGAGTLYGALKTMQKNGWIEQAGEVRDSRGKKEYRITALGKEIYEMEIIRLRELLKNAERTKER